MDHRTLVVLGHAVEALLDIGRGGIGPRHLDGDRVLQIALRQLADLRRESGREQQRLPGLGQKAQDALQVGQEPNVEHAVGFVEHHVLDLVEHAVLGLDVVEQAARRGDQHLHAFFQLGGLRLHVDAAENHHRAQLGVLGVGLDVVGHLVGQLAGRREHQCAHGVPRRRHRGRLVLHHLLQQRQRESRRLAGAGLRRTHHVAAFEHQRDRLGLDRRHRRVARIGHRAQQFGVQRQGLESLRDGFNHRLLGCGGRIGKGVDVGH